jgi:hypothetical protein
MAEVVKNALISHIDALSLQGKAQLQSSREARLASFGRFEEA